MARRACVRATAAGFCYNFGRIASAAAPYTVGSVAQSRGFGAAFTIAGAAFLLAALAWLLMRAPEAAPIFVRKSKAAR